MFSIPGEVIRETEKAWLFSDGVEKIWLPKSRCEWDEGEGMMSVPEWMAIEKGLV